MIVASTRQDEIEIKRIELFLINQDNNEIAPIRVPFPDVEPSKKASYMIDGQYLPFPGKWKAEIRILDSEDNEQVFTKDFAVY
jgi:copper transport protein